MSPQRTANFSAHHDRVETNFIEWFIGPDAAAGTLRAGQHDFAPRDQDLRPTGSRYVNDRFGEINQ
jgi:hypothetical protein